MLNEARVLTLTRTEGCAIKINGVMYRVTDQQYRYSPAEHSVMREGHSRSNGKTVSQSCASQDKVGGKCMKQPELNQGT